ncbi:MAG TPA: PKD domain-containing protein [Bacteroidia bacterium]|jgi:PKD repeat protein|nr:PKD domain-containing protein [Bacteroidia bacterium]
MKTKQLKNSFTKLFFGLTLVLGLGWSNIIQACTANFTYTTGVNGQVFFTSTSSGFGWNPSYIWNPGDASGNMYGNNPSHTYLSNGTYSVHLLVTDSLCTDTITLPVVITNVTYPCTLSASFTVTYGAHGAVTFTSTSTGTYGFTQYYWNPGDGSGRVSGSSVYNHTYTYKGDYTVYLTLVDTGVAYCMDSIPVFINVGNADSNAWYCHLHTSFTYSLGANGNVTFTSTSSGLLYDDSLFWNPGDASGVTSYAGYAAYTGYNHAYTANGTYNVKLLISGGDSGTCSDSMTVPVTITNVDVAQPCTLSANFSITYNPDGNVTLTSTSTGTYANTMYYWNPGDGSGTVLGTNTFSYTYPFLGTYNATLIIRDTGAGFCNDSITLPVYITNRDSLSASFTYVSDSLVAGQYDFTSTSRGTDVNTYYKWTPGDGNPADSGIGMTTYDHIYSINGPYSATLTIWYTILPHRRAGNMIYYDLSSYTAVINVNTVTGVASISGDKGQFNLYPNPSNGQFRIALSNMPTQSQNVEVDICNILGETVYKTNYSASSNQLIKDINMPNTPAGLYFVRILTGDKTYTAKMVIGK